MASKLLVITLLGLFHISCSTPVITLHDLEVTDDTQSVGSYIREVRAAPPDDYNYENEGDGEIGYSRKKTGGGKKGYQFFDAYHKKAGDNYEFEKQDSYGKEDEDEKGAHSHRHETKAKYRRPRRENADESSYEESEGDDEGSESDDRSGNSENDRSEKNKRRDHPSDHSELREGEADGNGGQESFGHDPNDYTLPEKYSYGQNEDEEYNF